MRGESPLASHLLWPGILDDSSEIQRHAGMEAGLAWGRVADATVVYADLGISRGMQHGIERALVEGRPVEHRFILRQEGKHATQQERPEDQARHEQAVW
jgi:hypothetical protein